MAPRRVVVVGSLNVDHTVDVPRLPVPGETLLATRYRVAHGGKGGNQAIAAARQGAAVSMVACVGDDHAGTTLVETLAAEGIDVTGVVRHPTLPTGVALIAVAGDDNTIVVAPGANAALAWTDASDVIRTDVAVVLAQLEVPLDTVEAAFAAARAVGATTVLNPAPAADLPPSLVALVDVLVPNETEAAAIADAVDSVPTAVVTEAERGALVREAGRSWRVAPMSPPGPVVDPTGAGDAFCGAFVAALAAGLPREVALRRAAAAGAWAVTVPGAVPSLPRARDVDRLLAGSTG